MATRLMSLASLVAVWFAPGLAYPCGESEHGPCDWLNPAVTYTLTETKDGLVLASVVQGCPRKRLAHQERVEAEIARARKGEACDGCPFGVRDLSFAFERTDLGAVVRIAGPKSRLDEFKKRFEAKMAARGPAGEGCRCAKKTGARDASRFGPQPASTCGD